MKRNLVIRISGILFILAFAGVMSDALDLVPPEPAIGTMFLAMLLGSSGLALFLWRTTGWWAAGLGAVGMLLVLVANFFYPTDTFAWMFALGLLVVGLALLLAGRLSRLASLIWLASGILGLPPVPRVPNGTSFVIFGVALLVLGYLLWTEAGSQTRPASGEAG